MLPRLLGLTALVLVLACNEPSDAPPPSVEPAVEPAPEPFEALSEDELRSRIQNATRRAREEGKHVLLDFVADWCTDCREVVRVSGLEPARSLIEEDYVLVYVDVGDWNRHDQLRERYGITRIATLVVLDGSGRRLAQTTLEPISNNVPLSPEALASWLRAPRDPAPSGGTPPTEPLFPAELAH